MAETTNSESGIYWKVAGALVVGLGLGYAFMKYKSNKANGSLSAKVEAKKAIQDIVNPPSHASGTEVDAVENKVTTGEFRTDGFTGATEDVAVPLNIKVVQKAAQPVQNVTVNDTGSTLPVNAFTTRNGNGFNTGDVIYSNGNQMFKIARPVTGSYSFADKNGDSLGTASTTNRQKLGVIKKVEENGVFFKISPDFKKFGFIGFEGIYKLS